MAGGQERVDRDGADVAGPAGHQDPRHGRTLRGPLCPSLGTGPSPRQRFRRRRRSSHERARGGTSAVRTARRSGGGRRPRHVRWLGRGADAASGSGAVAGDGHGLRRGRRGSRHRARSPRYARTSSSRWTSVGPPSSPGRSRALAGRAPAPRARRRVRARPGRARRRRSNCAGRPRPPGGTASRPDRAGRPTALARPGAAARSPAGRLDGHAGTIARGPSPVDSDAPGQRSSVRAAWARRRSVGRSLSAGSAMTRSSSSSRIRPRRGPGVSPRASIRSVAVDRQAGPVEDEVGAQLGGDPRPELVQPARAGRQPRPDVVGLAQVEQLVERAIADRGHLPDEPPDGRVGPARLVAEHVLADELDDPVADGARRSEPVEEGAGQLGADRVVAHEPAVGERRRLADVVEERRQADDRPRRRRRIDRTGACGPTGPRRGPCSGARRAAPPAPGEIAARRPVSLSSRSPIDGVGAASSLSSSAAIRSPDRCATSVGLVPGSPASVAASIVEAERRGEPDRADHPERVLLEPGRGSPTARSSRARRVRPAAVRIDEAGLARRAARPRPWR